MTNGYMDLQVNGYGGVDFNQDELTADALHTACKTLQHDCVSGILATIITEQIDVMCHRVAAIVRLRVQDPLAREIIAGIHIEGPFISGEPGYRGAHPEDAVRPADTESAKKLIDAGEGLVRLMTLAPEQDRDQSVIKLLANNRILVSAGHTNATLDDLRAAADAGLTLATHLGNGCPMTMHRHDNIVQRVLSLGEAITPCFIADGVHVPPFALKNYLTVADPTRCVVVTDAMSAAGNGPGRYRIGRWDLEVGDDLVVWAPGRTHFVGSAGTMKRSEQMLRSQLGLAADLTDRLLKQNPAKLLTR